MDRDTRRSVSGKPGDNSAALSKALSDPIGERMALGAYLESVRDCGSLLKDS